MAVMNNDTAVDKRSLVDAWLPPEMAERAESIGVKKAGLDFWTMLVLGVLAGAFIGLGALFATTVTASPLPYGVNRLLGGLAFCLGLILVVVAGAELFTGNNLIAMAWANGKVSSASLLRNWVIVYAGNFIGATATAGIVFIIQTVFIWERSSRQERTDHCAKQMQSWVNGDCDAGGTLQRTGLLGGVAELQRAVNNRQDYLHHFPYHRVRCRRV